SNRVQVKLFNHAPRQTLARQDIVLGLQVVIRHVFQLIKLLDGRDVRVFPLNFERHLRPIDGLLLQGRDHAHEQDHEKYAQNGGQPPAKSAAQQSQVVSLVRFRDFKSIAKLHDLAFQRLSFSAKRSTRSNLVSVRHGSPVKNQ